ncbi:hypothetical protein CLU79DRAFT_734641 [Phycomyces nitens]|nr:hypothetical protein CLU79DRAFT_734641 [Phycomyces nitens]
MSDGMLSRHGHMNAGAISTSVEELAYKHQVLFQRYSQIKAQHVILKTAVIKEKANNAALHGNVKEKEKELRKLQEQLDLLAFHNERLTKRIDAFQEGDTKGSHFSLLGGPVKKELEKSTQALDAANLDLAKKIEDNERLHEELSEVNHIYTDHANRLHAQIAEFERKIEEMQMETSTLQSERRNQAAALKNDKATLLTELERLQAEVQEKNRILGENEKHMRQGDVHLVEEINSLRAILLAKAGDVEGRDTDELFGNKKLAEIIPACDALVILEEQAKNYIYALREQTTLKGLPHEIAAKLKTSSETWSEEVQRLAKSLEESELKAKTLSESSIKNSQQSEKQTAEYVLKITALETTMEELQQKLHNQEQLERMQQLETKNTQLEAQIKQQEEDLEKTRKELEDVRSIPLAVKEERIPKETKDQEVQVNIDLPVPPPVVTETNQPKEEEEEEESFVYPQSEIESKTSVKSDTSSSDEEEVFVYRGKDSLPEPENDTQESKETNAEDADVEKDHVTSESIAAREATLKNYYEIQIRQLTEKLQMADSKAVRYCKTVHTLRESMIEAEKDKQRSQEKVQKLQNDVIVLKEALTAKEIDLNNQVNTMTEFMNQLTNNK